MSVITLEPHHYKQWDLFVDQSPQGDVYCYSWWLEAITKSNFKILAIIENNEIVAGIPIAFDSQNKANEPPLTRTLGVLYKIHETKLKSKQRSAERRWLTELLEYLPLDDFNQMCMHHNFNDWLPFRWKGFNQTTRYTYIINYIGKNINDLLKNIDRETRRIIRIASENEIRVEITDDFDLLYKYVSLSYKRQGLEFRVPYNDMRALDDAMKKRDNRVIFKAFDNTGKVHAVLYAAFNQKSAYALLSGSDAKLRKAGGHTLIMWEAIKYFIDKVGYFNFGGSDIRRIEAHLKGFGGTLTPYFHIYNEKLMWERNNIYYHIKELLFHIMAVLKIVRNKLIKTYRSGK
jgi:hypothetical protein